jgi:transposase-like protein
MINNTPPPQSVPGVRHRANTVSRWQTIVADFVASGLGVGEFCRTRSVCAQSFYAWRRRLSQGAQPGPSPAEPSFVPVVVRDRGVGPSEDENACASIQLRGGRVLRLPMSIPAGRMAELVHALEGLA